MSVLELRSVSKVYGKGAAEVQALRDVSLSVEAGTMAAVMGPSGSGKSSLLTIAGTLEEPTSGAVIVNGGDVLRMSHGAKARLRRRTIGYVFQDFNLLPGLTAVENVSLPLELDGMSARRAHLTGLAALEELGLADRAGSRSPRGSPSSTGCGSAPSGASRHPPGPRPAGRSPSPASSRTRPTCSTSSPLSPLASSPRRGTCGSSWGCPWIRPPRPAGLGRSRHHDRDKVRSAQPRPDQRRRHPWRHPHRARRAGDDRRPDPRRDRQ
jgi:ABC-type sugar transport system ATPase subunit